MKTNARPCNSYECAKGEGLPMHEHRAGESHLCVVATGRVEIVVGDKVFIRSAPAVLSLPPDTAHSIIALEDGTVFYNIY